MGPNPEKSIEPPAKPQLRVLVVEDANNPPKLEPGTVHMSMSKWKKLQRKQGDRERTILVVCRWCWADGHGAHRGVANVGAMAKNKASGLYEHDGYCLGRAAYDRAQGRKS